MNRVLIIAIAFLPFSQAAEKKRPQGQAENENVSVAATVLSADQVKAEFGSDFHGAFTVLDVRIAPKGGKPLNVRLDDFVLRSESDGDHSAPLVASQVGDGGALVVSQTFAPRSGPDGPQVVASSKVEMKDGGGKSAELEALKKKILAEKTITEAESGWLFFPLEHEKPKSLALLYSTPQGKLRLQFR